MVLRAKDPCHCGSERRYKHCHMEEDTKRRRTIQLISIFVPIVVIGIGLVLWSQRNDNASLQQLLTGQAGGSQTSTASADQSPLSDGRDPVDWEYDAEKDRHWDPGHAHWHDGSPPSEDLRTTATAPPSDSNLQNTNPNIPDPEPYQYDPLTNQHYDPGHGHWHNGQPPPPEQRSASTPSTSTSPITATSTTVETPSANQNPNISNPDPWQYDAVSNQHYDPGHGHWHNGQPPPEDQRNAAQPTTSTSIQSTGNSNPNIANPVPYQFDPNTNQYYDPNHAHWHSGQPPPPDQRQ